MLKYASLLILAAFLTIGCEKTAESAKEETTNTLQAVLTPKIKSALIANPILNEDGNLIDVTTDKETVTLSGHVMTLEAKNEATQIAQKVLDDSDSDFTLVNNLEIVPKMSSDDDKDKD
ncbi:MAG: BON domain-containing protein [Fimbriimonadaceae bacterium]